MTDPNQFPYGYYSVNGEFDMEAFENLDFNYAPVEPESQVDPRLTSASYFGPPSVPPSVLNQQTAPSVEPQQNVVQTVEQGLGTRSREIPHQQTPVQALPTPPTSLSPRRTNADHSQPRPSTTPRQPNHRKRKLETSDGGPDPVDDPEEIRKAKNRIAANKCREKKKKQAGEKVERENKLKEENDLLRAQFKDLQEQRLNLLDELFKHGKCGHPDIDKYMAEAAAGLVNNNSRGSNYQNGRQLSPSVSAMASSTIAHDVRRRRGSTLSARDRMGSVPYTAPSPVNAFPRRGSTVSARDRMGSGSYAATDPVVGLGSPMAHELTYPSNGTFDSSYRQDRGQSMMRTPSSGSETLHNTDRSRAESQQPTTFGQPMFSSVRDVGHVRRASSTMASSILASSRGVQPVASNADLPLTPLTLDPRLGGELTSPEPVNAGATAHGNLLDPRLGGGLTSAEPVNAGAAAHGPVRLDRSAAGNNAVVEE